MPTLTACFKRVIDEAYIRRGSDGKLDLSAVDYKIGEYDRNAIEEAARLRDAGGGGSVIGITVGTTEAAKGVKDGLSRGMDRAFFIADPDFRDLEPARTAAILAEVIQSRIPQYDLITCGEGSSDLYAQQVGPRLAELLGIPCVAFVQKITLGDGKIVAERKVEEGTEVVSAPTPALVTVLPDINTPRIPGVKDTLMAGKKPVTTITKRDLPSMPEARLKTVDMKAARMERSCEKFGTDPGEIKKFIDALVRKGVIR